MLSVEEARARSAANGGKLPFLTLCEFFEGNTDESSIAPNRWGQNPITVPLAQIAKRMRRLESFDYVAWVRVTLQGDGLFDDVCEADCIAICAQGEMGDLERAVDPDSLCADTIVEASPDYLAQHCNIPWVPPGHRIWLLLWD